MECNAANVCGTGHNTLCADWFSKHPAAVAHRVVAAGFGGFISILQQGQRDRKLLHALAKRWWDTTHTFHFNNNFSAITRLPVYGKPLLYNVHAYKNKANLKRLYGNWMLPLHGHKVKYTTLHKRYKNWVPKDATEVDQFARVLILALVGLTLFIDEH
ncbi:hypothetical protein GBA52_010451 [Prunus armeniaca]|nr:hypothetical protein GBA52_010451 [Prunus armeniaca]